MGKWNGRLDELLADDSGTLTAWEVEFTESLDRQRKRYGSGWTPSPPQIASLQKTWNRVFG